MIPTFQYTSNIPKDHPVVNDLVERLLNLSPDAMEAARRFPMRVPVAFAKRIPWLQEGPLSREFLPSSEELLDTPGYSSDPLDEKRAEVVPGLIGKYQGRVLLQVTTRCAIHCRYCFRRHRLDRKVPGKLREWTPALAFIAGDSSIREVIFSGGDPLTLTDRRLSFLAQRVAAIPHVRRLRIHTRMPVVTPERITPSLINWLNALPLTSILVIHVNHADELDASALAALGRLVEAGIPLLNQSVLLKGVNDDPEVMVALCEALVNAKVMPYYLHMLDPVAGSGHFHVAEEEALVVMEVLRLRLPGYAVPRLVREVPGEGSKRVL
ncbi:MAG: KamA family radical SAM protein [Magnetococcales bacterium]|nr:KamA family radical SAM protein [Magnetococcales bacterium]